MKVMIRQTPKGLTAYVAKKDLEELIVESERDPVWGGWVKLKNGWTLALPEMPTGAKLPVTVNATRVGGEDA
ncbi:MAG: putative nitrogen fixation protein NifT [Roseiarcus sp.]